MTEARMAVAVWTLLAPPHAPEMYMPIWPAATEWLPQPWLHYEGRTVELPTASSTQPRGSTVVYPDSSGMYELPEEPTLSAAHRAIGLAATRRSARALLTAAWQLYLAARLPTDLMWLDRLVALMMARDAMCEPPTPPETNESCEATTEGELEHRARTVTHRWQAGRVALRVDRDMRRAGWSPAQIRSVDDRARQLRHLAVHSADASLLALGYPPHLDRPMRRGPRLPGPELSPLAVREAVMPAFGAVRLMAVGLWERMLRTNFDDESYDAALSPPLSAK